MIAHVLDLVVPGILAAALLSQGFMKEDSSPLGGFPILGRTLTSFPCSGASILGVYRRSHFRRIPQYLGQHLQASEAAALAWFCHRSHSGWCDKAEPLETKAHYRVLHQFQWLDSFLVDDVLLRLHCPYRIRSGLRESFVGQRVA